MAKKKIIEASKPKEKKPSRAFTTHQVAALCGVHFTSIIRWIGQGKLPCYKTPGGHRRIVRENLVKFMDDYGIPKPPEVA